MHTLRVRVNIEYYASAGTADLKRRNKKIFFFFRTAQIREQEF